MGEGIDRNFEGNIIAGLSNYYCERSNNLAELLALRDGLTLCKRLQLSLVIQPLHVSGWICSVGKESQLMAHLCFSRMYEVVCVKFWGHSRGSTKEYGSWETCKYRLTCIKLKWVCGAMKSYHEKLVRLQLRINWDYGELIISGDGMLFAFMNVFFFRGTLFLMLHSQGFYWMRPPYIFFFQS